MMYFIERVDIDSIWANTPKGKIMKSALTAFKHALIANPTAFKAMIAQLQNLAYVLDRKFGGPDLMISYSNGILLIAPYTNESGVLGALYYSSVDNRLDSFQIRDTIVKAVEDIDREVTHQFMMKGGDR